MKAKTVLLIALPILILLLFIFTRSKSSNQVSEFIEPNINIPNTETIIVNDVVIKNPYNNPDYISNNANLYITEKGYQIRYSPEFDSFRIHITSQDFAHNRTKAEARLLKELGISSEDACQLTVNITADPNINTGEESSVLKLSFCQ